MELTVIHSVPDGDCFWHCLEYIFKVNQKEIKNSIYQSVNNFDEKELLFLGIITSLEDVELWKNNYLKEIYTQQGGDIELNILSYILGIRFIVFENKLSSPLKAAYGFTPHGIKVIDKVKKRGDETPDYYLFWCEGNKVPIHWDLVGLKKEGQLYPLQTYSKKNLEEWYELVFKISGFLKSK